MKELIVSYEGIVLGNLHLPFKAELKHMLFELLWPAATYCISTYPHSRRDKGLLTITYSEGHCEVVYKNNKLDMPRKVLVEDLPYDMAIAAIVSVFEYKATVLKTPQFEELWKQMRK